MYYRDINVCSHFMGLYVTSYIITIQHKIMKCTILDSNSGPLNPKSGALQFELMNETKTIFFYLE